MSDAGKAVFLSYASQDSEAAKKICDVLRAAGIEVWFDQNELVGGDAWDAKIRQQIKDCALFVPVISASTQARREGYFRIEWRLAAQRTHALAEGTPFLLPVVIDDTPEPAALVPGEFREVQWVRIGSADSLHAFGVRVGKLLGSEVAPVSDRRSASRDPDTAGRPARQSSESGGGRPAARSRRWVWPALVGIVGLGAIGGVVWKRNAEAGTKPTAVGTAATLAPIGEFPRDPQLRRVLQLLFAIDSTVGDFALAENLVKAVRAERPNDPEAVIVSADLNNWYYARYFDQSDERLAAARRDSEWAVQLAPDHPAALAVLGHYLTLRNSDPDRARRLLERAVALAPNEPRYHRHLARAAYGVDRGASIALYQEGARRFPTDVLSHYDLGITLRNAGRIEEAEAAFDRTIALAPIANAIMWKARILIWRHGNVAGAMAMMDRVPERTRQESRVLATRFLIAGMGGEVAPALNALRATPLTMLEDLGGVPKALVLGELHEFAGELTPARLQYEGALAVIQQQIARDPTDPEYRLAEAWVRLKLGQPDEARRLAAGLRAFLPQPYRTGYTRDWWYTLIPLHLLLGDRAQALQLITESAVDPEERRMLRNAFALDRRMTAWRDDAEIRALIAEPASPTAAAK